MLVALFSVHVSVELLVETHAHFEYFFSHDTLHCNSTADTPDCSLKSQAGLTMTWSQSNESGLYSAGMLSVLSINQNFFNR